ncbi:delta 1-pyrroline-5-carboxylate reductase [Lithohypha guttulata]|nr:delta 1-pyrroline-5-carboxylate reductase [Lithohypha guttulata]
MDGNKSTTLTVLGCGNLGLAILSGILDSISKSAHQSGGSNGNNDLFQTPTRFVACVQRPQSAERIRKAVAEIPSATENVEVFQKENLRGVQQADVVILGCKPYMVANVLGEEGMQEALAGKLLISICAGVPVDQISQALYGTPYAEAMSKGSSQPQKPCTICRVMPNTAALVRQSMTVIATSNPPLPQHYQALTEWMFNQVGRIVQLPPHLMDVSTALCGSGPAFVALMIEALSDGAVAMGLPRAEAQLMASQTLTGTAGLVLNGEHPALVREKVCTPGGCTMGGLIELEEGGVRGIIGRAVRRATVVASQLGKGVSGVNGMIVGSG